MNRTSCREGMLKIGRHGLIIHLLGNEQISWWAKEGFIVSQGTKGEPVKIERRGDASQCLASESLFQVRDIRKTMGG